MPFPTAVIDTADWLLAVPLQATAGTIDFSGTKLSVALAPAQGGPVVQTASTDGGTLAFVPASGDVPAYIALDLRVQDRTWAASAPMVLVGDILRNPDPANPDRVEWIGRIGLRVLPGSNSAGISTKRSGVVLVEAQPYDNRIVMAPMIVGPQGGPGLPAYPSDAETKTYALKLVNGVLAWV